MALIVSGLGLVARFLPITNHATLIAAVASPFLSLAALLATALFILVRRWTGTAMAIGLVIVVAVVQLPLFIRDTSDPDAVPVRIMTANIYLGHGGTKAVAAEAMAKADVFAVQELTQDAVDRLSAAGLDDEFPYRLLEARAEAAGVGIWSRYPIVDTQRMDGYTMAMVSVRINVDGVAVDPTVLVSHLAGPWPQPLDDWKSDISLMPDTMRTAVDAAGEGCVMVAGDFNATLDMMPFRRLLAEGYGDAAEQAGAGPTFTYPANSRVPPFMGIDHVLTSHCTATSVDTLRLPGSDHRGMVATIAVPRTPSNDG